MLTTLYILVVAHLIADFILQGSLATKKRWFNKYMLAHAVVMALAFFLPLINYPAGKTVVGAVGVFISHALIDALRVELNRILKVTPGTYLFAVLLGIDQILHISIIYLLFNFFVIF